MEKEHAKAGYAQIVLTGLVDAALVIFLFVGIVNSFGPGFWLLWLNSLALGCLVLYRLVNIGHNWGTLGMQVLGFSLLNGEEETFKFFVSKKGHLAPYFFKPKNIFKFVQ